MKKFNVAAIAIFALGVGLIAGPAISASQSNVINACVNKSTGLLRIAKKCTKAEKPLSWNKQGLQGEQGLQGLPGQPGTTFNYGLSPIGSLNCFQKVIQADNSGFIWNKVTDRLKFESQTNCEVSKIDLNPNSQVLGVYRDFGQAQVLTSKLLAYEFTSGGETTGNGSGLYEVEVSHQTNKEICSSVTSNRGGVNRAFMSPVSGKLYAIGKITTNQFRTKSLLSVGLGESTSTVTLHDGNNGDNYFVYSEWGGAFIFESMVQSLPKNSTTILKLIAVVNDDGEEFDVLDSNLELEVLGGALAKVTRLENQEGYKAVFQLETNDFENGNTELVFRINQEEDNTILEAYESVSVGVEYCSTLGDTDTFNQPLNTISDSRLVIEDPMLPTLNPSEEVRRLGWVWGSWFE
jgi:hypothetical protein